MKLRIYYVEANNKLQYIECWSTSARTAGDEFIAAHPEAKAGLIVEIAEFSLIAE